MAVTKGQGNPNWNRDETILALSLYLELGGPKSQTADVRIGQLSKLLKALPYHAASARGPTFRNEDGVKFKLQNLHSVITGDGLAHVSKMDREIVSEFWKTPEELRNLAGRIKIAAPKLLWSDFNHEHSSEELSFFEGRIVFALHKKRERNQGVRKRILERRRLMGLSCELCGIQRPNLPIALQEALFECHHKIPLAEAEGQRATKISDVALLCACCHRFVHKLSSLYRTWLSIEDATEVLNQKLNGS